MLGTLGTSGTRTLERWNNVNTGNAGDFRNNENTGNAGDFRNNENARNSGNARNAEHIRNNENPRISSDSGNIRNTLGTVGITGALRTVGLRYSIVLCMIHTRIC